MVDATKVQIAKALTKLLEDEDLQLGDKAAIERTIRILKAGKK